MTKKEQLAHDVAALDYNKPFSVHCYILGFEKARRMCAEAMAPFTLNSLPLSPKEYLLTVGEETVN